MHEAHAYQAFGHEAGYLKAFWPDLFGSVFGVEGRNTLHTKILTVGRCADGARGDTPGEFKVEQRKIFQKC